MRHHRAEKFILGVEVVPSVRCRFRVDQRIYSAGIKPTSSHVRIMFCLHHVYSLDLHCISPSVYLEARNLTAAAELCHSTAEISTNTSALAGFCFPEATHIRLGTSISPVSSMPDGSHISLQRALASTFNLHLAPQFHATSLDRSRS